MTIQDRFKFRVWDGFANKYFDEETDPLFENVYECMKQQIFYNSGNPLYGRLAYNHAKDGRVFEQCTGLKDKNGKLIYEGDIVYYEKCTNFGLGGYRYARVFWLDNVQGFAIETNYGDYYGLQDFDIEIVGNIHENLDLLENKDE